MRRNQPATPEVELFECSKCGQHFEQILYLQCKHDLCVACASKLFQRTKHDTNSGSFSCEICGVSTLLNARTAQVLSNVKQASPARNFAESRSTASEGRNMNDGALTASSLQGVSSPKTPKRDDSRVVERSGEFLYCFTCEVRCFSVEN